MKKRIGMVLTTLFICSLFTASTLLAAESNFAQSIKNKFSFFSPKKSEKQPLKKVSSQTTPVTEKTADSAEEKSAQGEENAKEEKSTTGGGGGGTASGRTSAVPANPNQEMNSIRASNPNSQNPNTLVPRASQNPNAAIPKAPNRQGK